jgi:GTP-binding protein EngB required for normal cell division
MSKEILNTLGRIHSFLSVRITTNIYTLIFVLLFVYLFYLYVNLDKKVTVNSDSNKVLNYLDSIDKRNKILFSKIDSLDLNKKEKITIYHKTTLKYDTLKIMVDSMPPIDATLFLLSKSRQLTDKGIE